MNKESTESNHIADFTERFINQTKKSIFLTGKAGTGKTTLLQKIVKSTHKETVIVAPTGIAALNAGGVTIHSFFQLPFAGFVPDFKINHPMHPSLKLESKSTLMHHFRMNKARRAMFRAMELLIVDEVSMLRADVLDAMDWMLRNVRKVNAPFGGVQVLFIGDLLQLPPVIKPQEWSVLSHYYKSPFFFEAHVIRESPLLYMELEKVYRQEDERFINVLNHLRTNTITSEDIELLNQYVRPDFDPIENEDYITLTTHNADADRINTEALNRIQSKSFIYEAEVNGNFPDHMLPLSTQLELKVGAQVMFIKNDLSYEKRFYNGKMARVVSLSRDEIRVQFLDSNKTIEVEKYEWENTQFELNPSTGEVNQKTLGTFVHYPLKLAWAITVHKSQGLTFDKAVIDVSKVFVSGQSYVALSRLRSLDGLVLMNPINPRGLALNVHVANYTKENDEEVEFDQVLAKETANYLRDTLVKAFDWVDLFNQWRSHLSSYKDHGAKSIKGKNLSWITQQVQRLETTLEASRKFRGQLTRLFGESKVDFDHILERVQAGYHYFFKSFDGVLYSNLKKMGELQQQRSTKTYNEELEELDAVLTESIIQLKKAVALMEASVKGNQLNEGSWVDSVRNYKQSVIERVKAEIREANAQFDFDTNFVEVKTKSSKKKAKKDKLSTFERTLAYLKEGMSVREIADERQMSSSTIYTHCQKLLQQEKIELKDVMEADKINALSDVFDDYDGGSLTDLKKRVGSKYTWDELKLYRASLLV